MELSWFDRAIVNLTLFPFHSGKKYYYYHFIQPDWSKIYDLHSLIFYLLELFELPLIFRYGTVFFCTFGVLIIFIWSYLKVLKGFFPDPSLIKSLNRRPNYRWFSEIHYYSFHTYIFKYKLFNKYDSITVIIQYLWIAFVYKYAFDWLVNYFYFLFIFSFVYRAENKIKHCRIKQEGRLFIIGTAQFESLVDLVSYYEKHPLFRKIRLRFPVTEDIVRQRGIVSFNSFSFAVAHSLLNE